MLRKNLVIAWRHIKRDKLTTTINLLGLVIGLTACLVTYLIIVAELSYDTFHPDKDRIYRALSQVQAPSGEPSGWSTVPFPATEVVRAEFEDVESLAVFIAFYARVSVPFEDQQIILAEALDLNEEASDMIVVQPDYFDIFQYEWEAGDKETALNEPFQVVLTTGKAEKYFGSMPASQVLGREVIYNDSLRMTVTGVVKDWEQNTDFIFGDFISFATVKETFLNRRANLGNWQTPNRFSQTFVKLKPNASPIDIEQRLVALLSEHAGQETSVSKARLQPLTSMHIDEAYGDMNSERAYLPVLFTLLTIAFLLLTLAIVNYVNLATAQSLSRSRETSMRKTLGSTRPMLIFQFLTETFLLTSFAIVLAVLLVPPTLEFISAYIPKYVGLYLIEPWAIVVIALLISLAAGIYPAFVISGYSPVEGRNKLMLSGKQKKNSLRKVLIVFQFTISIVLIICTLVINYQIYFLLTADMGFNKNSVVSIDAPGFNYDSRTQQLYDTIRQLPGVETVSLNMGPPIERGHRSGQLQNSETGVTVEAELHSGDEHYLGLYEIDIVAGRNFGAHAEDSLAEFVINESTAKQLGFSQPADALGKMVESNMFGPRKGPVVGVVADFHSRPLQNPIRPAFFLLASRNSRTISIKIAANSGEQGFADALLEVEKAWMGLYPNERFRYSLLEQEIAEFYAWEFNSARVMGMATLVSLFISCIGLFGLVTFTTELRTKEIGVRKVMGASITSIVVMLCREFTVLVLIAIAIASPLAWFMMNTWLKFFAYHASIDWWIFVLAGVIALLIALLTVSFHAIRVARSNPVHNLRVE